MISSQWRRTPHESISRRHRLSRLRHPRPAVHHHGGRVGAYWAFTEETEGGGNTAALAACSRYVALVSAWSRDHDGRPFVPEHPDRETYDKVRRVGHGKRILAGRILVRTGRILITPRAGTPRQQSPPTAPRSASSSSASSPHDDLPLQPSGQPAPAHAVAWCTGETCLISPEDFARLDLGNFIDARDIVR